jgi:hypothetical protein
MPARIHGNWAYVDRETFEDDHEEWVSLTTVEMADQYEVEMEVFTRKIRHREVQNALSDEESGRLKWGPLIVGEWKPGYPPKFVLNDE